MTKTILFAYDSADNAHAAIVAAGSLLTRQNGSSVAVSVGIWLDR